MKNLLHYLKPYKLSIIIAYFLTSLELAAELLFPFFLGIIINQGIMEKDLQSITFWGLIMLAISVFTFITGIINSYYASHVSNSYGFDVRERMFEQIQTFSFEQLSRFPTSGLVTRFTNDIRQIQNTIFMALRIMTKAPFMVVGGVIMSFVVNVKLAAIFLITVPLLTGFLFWVLMRGSNMFKVVQERIDHINRVIQENIAGIRVIKAFVNSQFEKKRFSNSNQQLATESQSAFRFMEASMPILLFVMNLSLLFILWYGNIQIHAGTTLVGDVVAIVNYALRIVMFISMFTFIAMAFSRAKASAERVDVILDETVEDNDRHSDYTLEMTRGKVHFDHVSFSYPDSNVPILHNVSFTIEPQTSLAVIGATGAGKTTLFQLLPRLYKPSDGNIYIDDHSIHQYKAANIRDNIGYVPQSPLLFTGTISENLKFGKEDATKEEIIQAAKDAQIHDTIMSFPEDYDTIVGQRGVNLSGGQKQRVSIARALVRQPKILMFDDSTSALDLTTEARLLEALTKYNCSTLIITQKISTAKQADNIMLLDNGELLAYGSHEELLQTSDLYNRIIESQMEKEIPYV